MKSEKVGNKSEAEKKGEISSKVVKCLSKKNGAGPTCSTPVSSWKSVEEVGGFRNTIIKPTTTSSSTFHCFSSARKLAALFWEFHQYQYFSGVIHNSMYLGVNNHHQKVRRHHNHHHRGVPDPGFDDHHDFQQQHHRPRLGFDPLTRTSPNHHPASAGSLRRHIAASLMRHHQSAERNKHALQPLSPASYGSSLEIAPYKPAATPDSSIELRERIGESSYSFKTSTELLKVLNRIWSLEEQHASNVSLVKALKAELDLARSRIKGLLKDQQANRHEIDHLMKQISEDSLTRKSKDHERIDAALQSVRDELEDERRLRKRSESLHRKLARELFEVKVALSTSVKDYEKEKKSNEILEELCDEFAEGIRDYAKQVYTTKQKSDEGWTGASERDNLLLHMSESWLDERTQVKDGQMHGINAQRQPVTERLRHEIENFLAARQVLDLEVQENTSHRDPKESRLRRRSLESIPEAVTGPQASVFSDSHDVEVSKQEPSNYGDQDTLAFSVRSKVRSPPGLKMSDSQNTPGEFDARIIKAGEGTPTEISMLQKSDIYDPIKERRKNANDEEGHGSNSKTVDKLMSELLLSEGGSLPPNNAALRRNVSPIKQWMASMSSPDPTTSETYSKMQTVKDNSLKGRLQEPKAKGQRSRLKILKGSS